MFEVLDTVLRRVTSDSVKESIKTLNVLNKNYSNLTYTMYWCAYSKLLTDLFVDIMWEDERVCGNCPVREACQRNVVGKLC